MSPHLNQVALIFHGLVLAASSKTTTKSSSSATLLLLIGLALLVYLFVLRPRSQRMRRAQQQTQGAGVGDEVMLASGIIGRVTSFEGDRATIEIAPEIEIEIVRRAISSVLVKAEEEMSFDVPPDPGSDAYLHEHEHEYDEYDEQEEAGEEEAGEEKLGHDDSDVAAESDRDKRRKGGLPGPGAALDLGGEGPSHS